MSERPRCATCRQWRRLSWAAVVGRCVRESGEDRYSNQAESCGHFGAARTALPVGPRKIRGILLDLAREQKKLANQTQALVRRAATNAEITRQLTAETQVASGEMKKQRRRQPPRA